MTDKITIRRPDNWHCHFRDPNDTQDKIFWDLFLYIVRQWARCAHFGNYKTSPPMSTADSIRQDRETFLSYADRLLFGEFRPLMTVMMVRGSTPDMLFEAFAEDAYGAKTIPNAVSTNSGDGFADFKSKEFDLLLRACAEANKPWLSHSELPNPKMPPVKREAAFIPILARALDRHPDLRIVFEHVSTKEGVEFVRSAGGRVSATITPHHLYVTTEEADADPFLQCMPYPKSREHIEAVRDAALSGEPWFYFGDDSAPHLKAKKLVKPPKKPASGIFHSASLSVMAQFFDESKRLDLFGPFMSEIGAKWHGIRLNSGTVTLVKTPWTMPEEYYGVVPYRYGQRINWFLPA